MILRFAHLDVYQINANGAHASSSFVGSYSLMSDWRQNSHCSFFDYNHEHATYGSYVLFGQPIVSVVFDNATYIPTEYPHSTSTLRVEVRIGAGNNATEVAHCLDTDTEVLSTSTVTIDGVAFSKYNYGRSELSNRTRFSSYRTLHNNTCFAIEPAFSWAAYDPAVLMSMDQPIVDSVVDSFKFTK